MIIDYDKLLSLNPFSMDKDLKEEFFNKSLMYLSKHHSENCELYRNIYNNLGQVALPVRLFKLYDLMSVPKSEVKKTMTSSGTSGQAVSKIYLDGDSTQRQTKVLAHIVGDFLGKSRRPMLVIDSSKVLKDRRMFSARGAGILGFSMFGRGTKYALDENMELDLNLIEEFADKYKNEPIFFFGFTFMIWQYFVMKLKEANIKLNLNGTLIHGGGWKKLVSLNISNDEFKKEIKEWTGINTVLNYYGMVEQTGSIFMECPCGRLHVSNYSDINIIDPITMKKKYKGKGLIETISLLPTSYPGHILLTEDEGELIGIDDCPCGRLGKTFKIFGRLPGAEIRGCSDTHEP